MTTPPDADKILILDFGSQVTQLIARRVREAHVYCELHPYDMPLAEIRAFKPKGIILSGGPNSVYDSDYQLTRVFLLWVFRCWVFVTGCNSWRIIWAARFRPVISVSLAMRR